MGMTIATPRSLSANCRAIEKLLRSRRAMAPLSFERWFPDHTTTLSPLSLRLVSLRLASRDLECEHQGDHRLLVGR